MSSHSNLPSGWAHATLGDVLLAVVGGGTPSRRVPAYFVGSIPWFTVKDMKVQKPSDAEEHISEIAIADSATNLIPANTLIVATRIALGRAIRPTVACAINQDLKALVLGDGVNADFLLHWVGSNERVIQGLGSGTTVSGIRLEALHGLPLKVPPAAEQTRIVEKLEELLSDLDVGVAELKAAQKKLAQYRQSLLKAAVEGALTADWRAARSLANAGSAHAPSSPPSFPRRRESSSGGAPETLDPRLRGDDEAQTGAQLLARILTERRSRWQTRQLARFQAQGRTPPKDWQAKYPEPVAPDTAGLPELPSGWVWASIEQLSPDDLANGRSVLTAESGAKVLRLTAVKHGRIDLSEYKIGAWSINEAEPFAVVQGDLLIVRGNGSLTLVGRAGMVPMVTEQVAYPDTMIRLRVVDSVVRPEWVGLLWDASITRSHLETRARTSAGIYKISQPDIVSVVIPVPPLNEQDLMLSMFKQTGEEMHTVHAMVERGLKQSSAQRKNILQAAFSGQLVPQDPADEPASVLLARIRAERAVRGTGFARVRGKKTGAM